VPKRVDHEERRRQIADALLRTAAARGLHATGMREVAAEAGVSLRLVQYYFGTKEELLLSGMQHLAARFGERAMTRIRRAKEAGGKASPRDVIAAILAEALPADDERRTFAVLNAAYFALALTDKALAIAPLVKNTNAVIDVIAAQLRTAQAAGDTPAHLEPDAEALNLLAMSAGLGNSVLAGQSSLEQAQAVIDYHLDRLFPASRPALRPVAPDGGVGCEQARTILAHNAAGTRRAPWRSRPGRFFSCLAHLASRGARPLPRAHGSGRLFSGTLIAERSQRSDSGSSANRGMTCMWGCRAPPWFQPSK
jgi:AcrR family transcriptional regulator